MVRLNKKVEEFIRKTCWKGMTKANNINKKIGVDLGEEKLSKWLDRYIKFLNITFKIVTGLTISLTFLLFLPKYLHLTYDKIAVIVLVALLLQLRFGSIKVKFE